MKKNAHERLEQMVRACHDIMLSFAEAAKGKLSNVYLPPQRQRKDTFVQGIFRFEAAEMAYDSDIDIGDYFSYDDSKDEYALHPIYHVASSSDNCWVNKSLASSSKISAEDSILKLCTQFIQSASVEDGLGLRINPKGDKWHAYGTVRPHHLFRLNTVNAPASYGIAVSAARQFDIEPAPSPHKS